MASFLSEGDAKREREREREPEFLPLKQAVPSSIREMKLSHFRHFSRGNLAVSALDLDDVLLINAVYSYQTLLYSGIYRVTCL